MAVKSQILAVTNGTDKFYFKASIKLYDVNLINTLGLIPNTSTKAVALVDIGELIRSGLAIKIQVRTGVLGSATPPVTTPLLCAPENLSTALAYFNNTANSPVLGGKAVLGANVKRDKHYV